MVSFNIGNLDGMKNMTILGEGCSGQEIIVDVHEDETITLTDCKTVNSPIVKEFIYLIKDGKFKLL